MHRFNYITTSGLKFDVTFKFSSGSFL